MFLSKSSTASPPAAQTRKLRRKKEICCFHFFAYTMVSCQNKRPPLLWTIFLSLQIMGLNFIANQSPHGSYSFMKHNLLNNFQMAAIALNKITNPYCSSRGCVWNVPVFLFLLSSLLSAFLPLWPCPFPPQNACRGLFLCL